MYKCPLLDNLRHMSKEEGQQQGTDMAAIHIGVRHDNDSAIAQPLYRQLVVNPRTQRGDQGFDLVVVKYLVDARPFGVENFAS